MRILLTNDDGIYAPGLWAMERVLRDLGAVSVVAPTTEQSGVGHAITFLTPLVVKELFLDDDRHGWAVDGSPADCVKLAVTKICAERPHLVVSGINGGQNAGINVLYSGTVAAAIEGAFFGVTSIAVSLQYDEHAQFDKAARLARDVIEKILANKRPEPQLYNLNIPTAALEQPRGVRVVPMSVAPWGENYIERRDPKGRPYYWANGEFDVPLSEIESDLSDLAQGFLTLTPLDFDMTKHAMLDEMRKWDLSLESKRNLS